MTRLVSVIVLAMLLAGCQPSSLIAYTSEISCSFDSLNWQISKQDNGLSQLVLTLYNLDCN